MNLLIWVSLLTLCHGGIIRNLLQKMSLGPECRSTYTVTTGPYSSESENFPDASSHANEHKYYYCGQYKSSQRRSFFPDDGNKLQLEENDHIAFQYRVIKVLGSGSYSTVYHAFDHKERKHVALKISWGQLAQYLDIEYRELVRIHEKAEANNDDRVRFIIKPLGLVYYRGITAMVLPLLTPLLDTLTDQSSWSFDRFQATIRGVLSAIEALNDYEMLHCDLKTDNILLDDLNTPILADFGLCFSIQGCRKGGEQRCTSVFASPEVANALPFDSRSEVFSLGATMVDILTRGEYENILRKLLPDQAKAEGKEFFYPWRFKHDEEFMLVFSRKISITLFPLTDRQYYVIMNFIAACMTYDSETRPFPSELIDHILFTDIYS